MAVYITGDTHGGINSKKLTSKYFPNYKNCTKDDKLIVLGDWGYIYENENNLVAKETEHNKMVHTFKDRKWGTTLFIDGNHENFDRLNKYPEIEMFGGMVGKIDDDIYHLKRGYVYVIDGMKILTFGGANSIAKHTLTKGIDWWEEEKFNYEEATRLFDNLEKHNFEVDLILTHTCSSSALLYLGEYLKRSVYEADEFNRLFEELKFRVKFQKWFFGHHHVDLELKDNEVAVFKDFFKLSKENEKLMLENFKGYDCYPNKIYP